MPLEVPGCLWLLPEPLAHMAPVEDSLTVSIPCGEIPPNAPKTLA